MTELAVRLIAERLLWPVPRVRWEAGRSLAALIRTGDATALEVLLDWIRSRTLESEVVIGLSVIHAFRLGDRVPLAKVRDAVRAPSLLSDWLLAAAYPDTEHVQTMPLGYAPDASVDLPPHQDGWFRRFRAQAIPMIFTSELRDLERRSGLPIFMSRWEHEWRWLQKTCPRPAPSYPRALSDDRGHNGQFDVGQRELYVSAYLRTLAFAVDRVGVPLRYAAAVALAGAVFNPGLADLDAVRRPSWAGVAPDPTEPALAGAARIWAVAEAAVPAGDRLLSIRTVEASETEIRRYDIRRLIAAPDGSGFTTAAHGPDVSISRSRDGDLGGGFDFPDRPLDPAAPAELVTFIYPRLFGRVHTDLVSTITLPTSALTGAEPCRVVCAPDHIGLVGAYGEIGRWWFWCIDWEPASAPDAGARVCSMTTTTATRLDAAIKAGGGERVYASVTRYFRSASYSEFSEETTEDWLDRSGT